MASSATLSATAPWRRGRLPALTSPDAVPSSEFAFALFVIANAALYLRPADLIYREDLPIYLVLILGGLLVSYQSVVAQFSLRSLAVRPITLSLFLLLAAVVLSHLTSLHLTAAWSAGFDFFKKIAYYLVLVAVVDTPKRLRQFIAWFVSFIVLVVVLGLLHYHGVIDVPALASYAERQADSTQADPDLLLRLCSVGVFNNPNDLARIVLIAMPLALFGLFHGMSWVRRCFYALALGLFVYALIITYSRGGLLGFFASLGTLVLSRFGWKRTLLLVSMSLPLAYIVLQARHGDLNIDQGTGQLRVLIWSDGLELFREAPLFGIGYGEFRQELGIEAHNSFVQCFVELGVLGGSCFLAAFYVPMRAWFGLPSSRHDHLDSEVPKVQPYLLAVFAGYGVSLLTSTRGHLEQTYLIFGLATVYFHLITVGLREQARRSRMPGASPVALGALKAIRFATCSNARLLFQVIALGLTALIALDVFVRIYARYGYSD